MKNNYKFSLFFIVILLISTTAYSAQKTWNGSVDSLWTTAGNWTPNGAPSNTDTVTIANVGYQSVLTTITTVNRITMNSGTLNLKGFQFTVNQRAICNGGTIKNGKIIIRGSVSQFAGTFMDCKVDVISGQVKLDGSVFSDSCYLEQSGSASSFGLGGNKFNGPLTLRNSGSSFYFESGDAAPDTFNASVKIYNASSHGIILATSFNAIFNDNVEVNNTGTGQVAFGLTSGTSITKLASGKTISVGSAGFASGTLLFNRFVQSGSTAQTITLTGTTTTLNIVGSEFNGSVTFTAPTPLLKSNIFNGSVTLTKASTGTASAFSDGGNTFNSLLTITNSAGTSASLRMSNQSGDTYQGDVTLITTNGIIALGYSDTSYFHGNISINNTKASFNTGSGLLELKGSKTQTIGGSAAVSINKLIVNKTNGSITLSQPLTIDTLITFIKGVIQTDSINHIALKKSGISNGASDSSYVDGFFKKIGNTAFSFPLGKNGIKRQFNISSSSNVTDAFLAAYIPNQVFNSSNLDTSLIRISGDGHWKLYQVVGNTPVFVTCSWNKGDNVLVDSVVCVTGWDGTKWMNLGKTAVSGNYYSGEVVSGMTTVYDYFTLGLIKNNITLSNGYLDSLNVFGLFSADTIESIAEIPVMGRAGCKTTVDSIYSTDGVSYSNSFVKNELETLIAIVNSIKDSIITSTEVSSGVLQSGTYHVKGDLNINSTINLSDTSDYYVLKVDGKLNLGDSAKIMRLDASKPLILIVDTVISSLAADIQGLIISPTSLVIEGVVTSPLLIRLI